MNLEQLIVKVAEEFGADPHKFAGPARRLVAELTKGQEPVAYYCGRNQFGSPQFRVGVLPITEGPLFAAPPICPTAEWQPIETAPGRGPILVVDASAKQPTAMLGCYPASNSYCGTQAGDWCVGQGCSLKPTHWMPLPAAPEYKP